jgi:hypothetical protein
LLKILTASLAADNLLIPKLKRKRMSLTKKDLSQIGTLLNNQFKAFVGLLKHELDPMRKDVKDIKETLDVHTNILDAHTKDLQIIKTESIVVNNRLKIHGKWFKQIANKIDIELVEE